MVTLTITNPGAIDMVAPLTIEAGGRSYELPAVRVGASSTLVREVPVALGGPSWGRHTVVARYGTSRATATTWVFPWLTLLVVLVLGHLTMLRVRNRMRERVEAIVNQTAHQPQPLGGRPVSTS